MNILLLAIAPSVFSNVYILFKFLLMLQVIVSIMWSLVLDQALAK